MFETSDLSILLLCGIFLGLVAYQHDQDIFIHSSWFLTIDDSIPHGNIDISSFSSSATTSSSYKNGHAPDISEISPEPIITDIDGDGYLDIVLVTREPKIKLIRLNNQRGDRELQDNGWKDAFSMNDSFDTFDDEQNGQLHINRMYKMKEISLLGSRTSSFRMNVRAGRQAVAVSTGYLEPYEGEPRSQHIVIVTESFDVLCFDSSLNLVWETSIEQHMDVNSLISEMTILIAPKPMIKGDHGVVVVGGRIEKGGIDPWGVPTHYPGVYQNGIDDPLEGMEMKNEIKPGMGTNIHLNILREHVDKNLDDDDFINQFRMDDDVDNEKNNKNANGIKVDPLPGSFLEIGKDYENPRPTPPPAPPLHHPFASNQNQQSRHFSYYAFEGKSGVLRWDHKSNDFIPYSPSEHGDSSTGRIGLDLRPQHEPHSGETGWRAFRFDILKHMPHLWTSRQDTKFQLSHFEKRRSGDSKRKKKEIESTEIIQHDSPLLNILPESAHTSFHSLFSPHSEDEHISFANVIVAHLRDGIEVIHLYSGRTLCRLLLEENSIHADINGDGVIDHIQAVDGYNMAVRDTNRFYDDNNTDSEKDSSSAIPMCSAIAVSGIPSNHQLYQTSICVGSLADLFHGFRNMEMNTGSGTDGLKNQQENSNTYIAVAPPALIPYYGPVMTNENNELASIISQNLKDKKKNSKKKQQDNNTGEKKSNRHHYSNTTKRTGYKSSFVVSSGLVTTIIPSGHKEWATLTKSSWSDPIYDSHIAGIEAFSSPEFLIQNSFVPSIQGISLENGKDIDTLLVIGDKFFSLLDIESGDILTEIKLPNGMVAISKPVIGDFR